ncbi:hybrid sensor histidine kinase/response regulator [Nostoc sp.]|uniref:hybrid sensor histidine kinase/response regulator n=1 Tax=Nostoc sp. TaxID=1180 RepID=UPI002FF87C50
MVDFIQNSILIVDNNPNNSRVLFYILHENGFKVSVVKSGEMALEKLPLIQPDLILLDVMMPGIDGFETCRYLKENEATKNIPVVFMTALSEVEHKVKALQLGAVDYITKPIQVEEVLARVNVHLELRNTQINLLKEISDRRQAETKLQQTLTELQLVKTQLIQSEKMSSLGQLVAGIAHEINNPVNFISANLIHANEYIKKLLKLLQRYQEYYPNPVPELQAEVEVNELDFMINDLPKLLQSMEFGAERIQKIVLYLRMFSRLDEAEMKKVNIHEGIDSTLMILGHRLQTKPDNPDIQVIKEYGNLPLIECYAGQINQVFMNILTNSIDALEEAAKNQKIFTPSITIYTEVINGDRLTIRIADNGSGIPENLEHRIFDPFFTSKPVGVGTGMGLAISYQIVTEKHHGSLQCVSKLGSGSEFVITIPLKQSISVEQK